MRRNCPGRCARSFARMVMTKAPDTGDGPRGREWLHTRRPHFLACNGTSHKYTTTTVVPSSTTIGVVGQKNGAGRMSFADTLKRLREKSGLSQPALAKKAGLSQQAVSHLEQGKREPALKTAQALAAALGVDCTAFNEAAGEVIRKPWEKRPRRKPK